jgi:hypothetical protein
MQKAWFGLAVVALLTACDDGGAARQALAQCKLSQEGKPRVFGHYEFGPLLLCMESKGYVEDNGLTKDGGERCGPDVYSHEVAACYRRDTAIAKWLTEAQAKR